MKEEWYAKINKLRKAVDQLFCKKFGEHGVVVCCCGFVFLEGCSVICVNVFIGGTFDYS